MIKLGDRVRSVHNVYGTDGRVGIVVGVQGAFLLVSFDDYHGGHNGDEEGVTYLKGYSYASCWYFHAKNLVVVDKINFPNRKTIEQVKEVLTYDFSEEID